MKLYIYVILTEHLAGYRILLLTKNAGKNLDAYFAVLKKMH